jgi:hypothetical protein
MGRIEDLLAKQVEQMGGLGSPVAGCVKPGHPPDETRAAIEAVGLRPTDEVLEWYAWFDGFDCPGTHDLFASMEPMTLAEAADRYERARRMADEDLPEFRSAVWRDEWWPLAWHSNAVLAVNLARDSESYGSVWNFDTHVQIYTLQVAPTLAAFLELLIAETAAGSVVWDPEYGAPVCRPGHEERLGDLGL